MQKAESYQVKVARESIRSAFRGGVSAMDPTHEMAHRAACFVSLHSPDGSLRGCIGTLEPQRATLYDEIRTNARSAAFHDPRFNPLSEAELEGLDISVDVLFPLEPITSEQQLDPQAYGVVVESGYRRGVLLPNLPGIDTVAEQLRIAKRKAGIGPSDGVTLYRFRVERYH